MVEDLATVVLVVNTRTHTELYGLEGASGANRGYVLARAGGEHCLGAGFGGLVLEDDAEGGVG